jgi:hypothetical protein
MKLNPRRTSRRVRLILPVWIAALGWFHLSPGKAADSPSGSAKKVAAIVTTYFHNSHADVIVSRLLQTDTLDGKGRRPSLDLASLYIDQVAENDIGRKLAADHKVPVYDSIRGALTLGGQSLAVDGVLLIGEHGTYPLSPTEQVQYPKRRFFSEVLEIFDESGRVVPVFNDKHLADNWSDAKWMYDQARKRRIPLMAGSSVPLTWRRPAIALQPGTELDRVVAISCGPLEGYGFHTLEMVQSIVEKRAGGETGVKSVQTLSGPSVWEAARQDKFDQGLLREASARMEHPWPTDRSLEEYLVKPLLFQVQYNDGLPVSILHVSHQYSAWAIAWREKSGAVGSTLYWTQEARPLMHFTYLVEGIEQMVQSGKPAWPAERTLLTTGILNTLMISRRESGKLIETPNLAIGYSTDWTWHEPPAPPTPRPLDQQ